MEEAVELRTVSDACDFVEAAWQRTHEGEGMNREARTQGSAESA
jgi:hypothetical protein